MSVNYLINAFYEYLPKLIYIQIMAGKYWTTYEEESLKNFFLNDGLAPSEIAIFLDRSLKSINLKIQRFGLKHTKEQKTSIKKRIFKNRFTFQ
jgi:hypothetical protein